MGRLYLRIQLYFYIHTYKDRRNKYSQIWTFVKFTDSRPFTYLFNSLSTYGVRYSFLSDNYIRCRTHIKFLQCEFFLASVFSCVCAMLKYFKTLTVLIRHQCLTSSNQRTQTQTQSHCHNPQTTFTVNHSTIL